MKAIESVLEKIKGSREVEILLNVNEIYSKIEDDQQKWYASSNFRCIQGCGKCCHNFKPYLFEAEAIFMGVPGAVLKAKLIMPFRTANR